ncbi:cell division protein ZapA [Candidatus Halobeggiatoa sp. HSG11]|nr:cell division protein ZapA [Candidatus Halobeggiatoa sp. HSG11]
MRKSVPVNLHILAKDYVIACPEGEQDTLLASVQFLKEKVQKVRESGKVGSTERIVVISALNIIHEYLRYQDSQQHYNEEIINLEKKLTLALSKLSG